MERDGALTPIGTVDLGEPSGGVESAPSGDTGAIWFLTRDVTEAVLWDNGTATRIELGAVPEATECDGCRLERVGQWGIVPGAAGGAVVVRNFADRSRVHRYCQAVQVSQTGVHARDVFPGFCAPVRTLGSPSIMVSEQQRTVLRILGETGWLRREVPAVRTYEDWVESDGVLYRIERDELVRVTPWAAGTTQRVPVPGLRPLAIAPARGGGLWAVIVGTRPEGDALKPPRVLVRLESAGQTSTSPALPDPFVCAHAAPVELADGRVAVPCREGDGRVNAVDVLVNGQWQKLRSEAAEAMRAAFDQQAASRGHARRIAPWLANTSPLVLVFVHFLFIVGLWLTGRGAVSDRRSSLFLGLLAALIGAAAGLRFGFFEEFASGWWRNDSLFPSFAREQWWLAKFTAAVAGAYLGVRLSRRGAWPRSWGFVAVSALVPVLSVALGWTSLEGSSGAMLIGFVACGYGFVSWLRSS
jgi:hypothetical protein